MKTIQYSGRRDRRFVALHRGGLLDVPHHRLLVDGHEDPRIFERPEGAR